MIPVSNSSALSVKSQASSAKTGALGWGLSHSDLSSREMLTYAHIGATGFHADKSAGASAAVAGNGGGYDASLGRNAFQDLLNANAAALAASEASVRGVSTGRPSALGTTGRNEPTWTVSTEGGRIQLAVNPNAR